MATINKYADCPCRSEAQYNKCCRPYHTGTPAPNALALMRSRYTAYALDMLDYLMATSHPEFEEYTDDKEKWKEELRAFCDATQFEGLEIKEFKDGDPVAYVTFRARMHQGLEDVSYTELSTFEKLDGRWLFKAGKVVEEAGKVVEEK